MIIANFTPDPITWTHEGISGTIDADKVEEFADNRGKFILSKFDRRGLIQLAYGDEEPQRAAEAMEKWKEFWIWQVTVFNEQNQQRKNENKPYNRPTKQLSEHAKSLELPLVGPWEIKPAVEQNRIEAMEKQMGTMMQTMNTLLVKMASDTAKDDTSPERIVDWDEIKNAFMFKSEKNLKAWVEEYIEIINTWPIHIRVQLIDKYERTYKGEKWPYPEPEYQDGNIS